MVPVKTPSRQYCPVRPYPGPSDPAPTPSPWVGSAQFVGPSSCTTPPLSRSRSPCRRDPVSRLVSSAGRESRSSSHLPRSSCRGPSTRPTCVHLRPPFHPPYPTGRPVFPCLSVLGPTRTPTRPPRRGRYPGRPRYGGLSFGVDLYPPNPLPRQSSVRGGPRPPPLESHTTPPVSSPKDGPHPFLGTGWVWGRHHDGGGLWDWINGGRDWGDVSQSTESRLLPCSP